LGMGGIRVAEAGMRSGKVFREGGLRPKMLRIANLSAKSYGRFGNGVKLPPGQFGIVDTP